MNKRAYILMAEATALMDSWIAMTESPSYRQTYAAVRAEFVTLCSLESHLRGLLAFEGLPENLRTIAQDYQAITEGNSDDVWDLAHERWPNPEAIAKDEPKTFHH